MKHWDFLHKGDRVDIIAPASHTHFNHIQDGADWLGSLGLKAHIPADLVKGDIFFASPKETQWEHLRDALYSDSKAIWCVRGGYGSMRLIPFLKKLKPPKKAKPLLGFSDITALHIFLNQEWKWPTIHSRNISAMKIGSKRKEDKLLADMLLGKLKAPLLYKNLQPMNEAALKDREIKGKIIGGNLRIIQSSLKTKWQINPKNKILFLEDVGERGYSLHRMFEQLIQAKLLDKGVKAVVLGDFTEGLEKNGKDLTPEALKRFAQSVSYPVLSGLSSGHGEINYPVPFHTESHLILGKKPQLQIESGGKAKEKS